MSFICPCTSVLKFTIESTDVFFFAIFTSYSRLSPSIFSYNLKRASISVNRASISTKVQALVIILFVRSSIALLLNSSSMCWSQVGHSSLFSKNSISFLATDDLRSILYLICFNSVLSSSTFSCLGKISFSHSDTKPFNDSTSSSNFSISAQFFFIFFSNTLIDVLLASFASEILSFCNLILCSNNSFS